MASPGGVGDSSTTSLVCVLALRRVTLSFNSQEPFRAWFSFRSLSALQLTRAWPTCLAQVTTVVHDLPSRLSVEEGEEDEDENEEQEVQGPDLLGRRSLMTLEDRFVRRFRGLSLSIAIVDRSLALSSVLSRVLTSSHTPLTMTSSPYPCCARSSRDLFR